MNEQKEKELTLQEQIEVSFNVAARKNCQQAGGILLGAVMSIEDLSWQEHEHDGDYAMMIDGILMDAVRKLKEI